MRALCGAIITAGALIGLGLTGLGIGTRYQLEQGVKERFRDMDNPLIFLVVFLTAVVVVGLLVSFVGLALHNERRFRERLHDLDELGPSGPRAPAA